MGISLLALQTLLPVFRALPKLEDLAISVYAVHTEALGAATPRIPWHQLTHLSSLAPCPGLKTIRLVVSGGPIECHFPPTAEDARDLLAALSPLRNTVMPDIMIEGFSREDMRDVNILYPEGFTLAFLYA
ncbi:hypothetical protein AURDEDRAFT_116061 [Auricularia subglabra TFB-10046 SS5]|uniref:Uncharacterized protein n=1 Tax=Auricularia subglabra (strain TFB-10046 / SS5) TaxID=717982 RepID=J0WXR7_AURST|nr:hypothetical protein AURDEDRAFT_116061 [Auricularia subglabra TFB-10046 SS5]